MLREKPNSLSYMFSIFFDVLIWFWLPVQSKFTSVCLSPTWLFALFSFLFFSYSSSLLLNDFFNICMLKEMSFVAGHFLTDGDGGWVIVLLEATTWTHTEEVTISGKWNWRSDDQSWGIEREKKEGRKLFSSACANVSLPWRMISLRSCVRLSPEFGPMCRYFWR